MHSLLNKYGKLITTTGLIEKKKGHLKMINCGKVIVFINH